MQQMNSAGLLQMTAKQLKSYIRAYNLSAKAAIEKGDLVRIILNTRPISNESEIYYRCHRDEHTTPPSPPRDGTDGADRVSSVPSTISQVFNDLFGGGTTNTGSRQREQSERRRRQDEQQRSQRQRQDQEQARQRRLQEEERQRQRQMQDEEQRRQRQMQDEEQRRRRQMQEEEQRRRHQIQEEERRRQQQRQQQRGATAASAKQDTISLDDMIRSNIEPKTLSVKTLKAILRDNFVEQAHALEKSDLVTRVQRLLDERRNELSANGQAPVNDDSLCRICCDAQQNCVFLDCGHMVTCMDCGKQLVANKNECPICREPILKLVHVFRS